MFFRNPVDYEEDEDNNYDDNDGDDNGMKTMMTCGMPKQAFEELVAEEQPS